MMQILHGLIQKQAVSSSADVHSFINHSSSYLSVLYKVGLNETVLNQVVNDIIDGLQNCFPFGLTL
jgi:hypothetical protein